MVVTYRDLHSPSSMCKCVANDRPQVFDGVIEGQHHAFLCSVERVCMHVAISYKMCGCTFPVRLVQRIQCFPGNIGRLLNISAKIHPTDQMSTIK